jgi:hypothetical protein
MLLLSSPHRIDVENEMNEKIQRLMFFIEIQMCHVVKLSLCNCSL